MRNTLYIFKAALMLYAKKSESRNINCHKEKGNNKICTKWKCGLFMIFVISNMITERNRKEEYLHKSWNYCVNSPTVYSSHRRYFFIWTPKELERTRREEAKKERNDRKRGETRHKNYFTSCWKKCFRHSRVVKKKHCIKNVNVPKRNGRLSISTFNVHQKGRRRKSKIHWTKKMSNCANYTKIQNGGPEMRRCLNAQRFKRWSALYCIQQIREMMKNISRIYLRFFPNEMPTDENTIYSRIFRKVSIYKGHFSIIM